MSTATTGPWEMDHRLEIRTVNYRLIAVSIIDGSTYDVAEYRDFQSVLEHVRGITRWDVHCFAVDISDSAKPYVLSTLLTRGQS
jgi:hypothetical protein